MRASASAQSPAGSGSADCKRSAVETSFNQGSSALRGPAVGVLQIDAAHMPARYPAGTLFHRRSLQCLWNLAAAALMLLARPASPLRRGQVFGLYLMACTAGRCWIEICASTMPQVWACASALWASLLVFTQTLVFVVAGRRAPDARGH